MSLDHYRGRRLAQPIEALLDILIRSCTGSVLVNLSVLLDESDYALFVNRRLSAHPLCLSHAVLDVIQAGGRPVHLRYLVRVSVLLFTLVDLCSHWLSFVEFLT